MFPSEEIQKRRALGQKAGELSRKSFLKDGGRFWKSPRYARASRMFAQAQLGEIATLDYQLRSAILTPEQQTSRLKTTEWQLVVDQLSEKRAHELRSLNCYPIDFEQAADF